jgi:hypothetical protein
LNDDAKGALCAMPHNSNPFQSSPPSPTQTAAVVGSRSEPIQSRPTPEHTRTVATATTTPTFTTAGDTPTATTATAEEPPPLLDSSINHHQEESSVVRGLAIPSALAGCVPNLIDAKNTCGPWLVVPTLPAVATDTTATTTPSLSADNSVEWGSIDQSWTIRKRHMCYPRVSWPTPKTRCKTFPFHLRRMCCFPRPLRNSFQLVSTMHPQL